MNVFVATTGNGAARASKAPDDEWSVEFLLADRNVRCLASDPLNLRVVYAGTRGSGVWRSEDRGKTWRPVGLGGRIVSSLAVSRSEPGAVYAGTKPALLYVSRDDGLPRPLDHMPYASLTDYRAPGHLYAGLSNGEVWHSADYGESWQQLPLSLKAIDRSLIML